jgi:cytochrome c peroxidase
MIGKLLTILALTAFMLLNNLAPTMVQANDLPDLARLGRLIFFDPNLSSPDGQACATCHRPDYGFADPRQNQPVSQGVLKIFYGNRNAPSAAYTAYSPPLHFDTSMRPGIMEGMYVGGLFWDGRVNTLEDQAQQPFLNLLEMHSPNKKAVVHAIRKSEYADLFMRVFGPDALANVETAYRYAAQAIAAYERSGEVNPFTSKFDYYLDGVVTLSEAEARGLALFTGKARCMNCHSLDNPNPDAFPGLKPLFTNFGYQNVGAPKNPDNPFYGIPRGFNPEGKNYVDLGLGAVLGDSKQNGKFKIPSLRNCAVTPPYEHNGVFKTLREVVMFNNTRDVPAANWPPPEVPENVHRHMPPMPGTFGQLGLTDQEVDDIVTFLETLTDGYRP